MPEVHIDSKGESPKEIIQSSDLNLLPAEHVFNMLNSNGLKGSG